MARINILIAASRNIIAEGIAVGIANRVKRRYEAMELLGGRVFPASTDDEIASIEEVLRSLPRFPRCVVIVVGHPDATKRLALQFLTQRDELVVLQADVVGRDVHIDLRNRRLSALLNTVCDLVEGVALGGTERIAQFPFDLDLLQREQDTVRTFTNRALLKSAIAWVHEVFLKTVKRVPDDSGNAQGFSVTRKSLLEWLRTALGPLPGKYEREVPLNNALRAAARHKEPLKAAYKAFRLRDREFKLLLLALAPEFDVRYQRCIGYLLDDMSRRTGTLNLYCGLLGYAPKVRAELAQHGAFWRWSVFEGRGVLPDEPLRLDPFLSQWLLGDSDSLAADPRVRRALRLLPWPGASLLDRSEEQATAVSVLQKLGGAIGARWLVLGGDDPESWRALLELGAECTAPAPFTPIRVEPARLAGVDPMEVEDAATRIGRMALLTRHPLVIDVAEIDGTERAGDQVHHFLAALDKTNCRAAVICRDPARIIRQFGTVAFELEKTRPLSSEGRVAAVRAAARGAGAYLPSETAESIARRYPLPVDRLEQAMRLSSARATGYEYGESDITRFTMACRELAAEGLAHLAERIEPVFRIEDVVLPADRKRQLLEIVNHVRLAPKVFDGWKFGEQLPYGRGVAALFCGPSGTGKTMAAMGIAHALEMQLLRVDLSRVVSKYIGDTEKNIDRVFSDAQRSGSAILIDEADALLGKRSEVKDAHDRYANIEVAYLLQRMEAYEGLAILTSNLAQNVDSAFMRRLRFVVEFPRPDVVAREQIWRFCLPLESHDLDDAAFRQLARKIDLTGGHIRQITLHAAFTAAAAGERIQLKHIAEAAQAEFAKLGMPPVELDLNVGRRAA